LHLICCWRGYENFISPSPELCFDTTTLGLSFHLVSIFGGKSQYKPLTFGIVISAIECKNDKSTVLLVSMSQALTMALIPLIRKAKSSRLDRSFVVCRLPSTVPLFDTGSKHEDA
jgi:hypothetical protein